MEIHKVLARQLICKFLGRNVDGIDAIPVLKGPLKGRLLPKQSATKQLSMLFGRYELAVIAEVLKLTEKAAITYNVGANVGFISLALAHGTSSRGRIFAFEPVPSNLDLLNKLVALNHLEERLAIVPLAVGDRESEQRLVMWGSTSRHLLEAAVNEQDAACCPSIEVQVTTLDSFVFGANNPPPDLIKIDVEGAEAQVLRGALRTLTTYRPTIIIEIHGSASGDRVWEIPENLDYSWLKLTKGYRSAVESRQVLLSYFTKEHWTHHFLLTAK